MFFQERKLFILPFFVLLIVSSASAEATSNTGTRVITLGTRAGPIFVKDRAQSSNLLIVGDTFYLIDAGAGVTYQLIEAGQDLSKVKKLFITHLHDDHTLGLATLLAAAWAKTPPTPIDIYGSGVKTLVERAIAYLAPNIEIRGLQGVRKTQASELFKAHEVVPGMIYEDEKIKVRAIENTHFNFPKESALHQRYRSYSYRFETPGRVVVFSGDTGTSDALTELSTEADLLVIESLLFDEDAQANYSRYVQQEGLSAEDKKASMFHMISEHISPEDVGKMAAKARVKKLVITHVVFNADDKKREQLYIDHIRKHYKGPVTIAKDLMQF